MSATRLDIEAVFHTARDIPDPERRRAFVREACAGDEALRSHVEALLAAADTPDSLLDQPAGGAATIDQPAAERAGTLIGPYKLLELIGEGGMGAVWMAQQTEPVKRLVALKLIKAGMDSKQVLARFEAERQALALMDHPNIARVLDGGTTPSGRPYFVMDLVKGMAITRYCDEHHLTPRQRLELFVPVCAAVQHAHQKGIIHRDLKPSNVLVALYDGKPVVKVIDFGVAKATGQALTDKTLVTGFGAVVGTLEYMSPEQAEINQLDIDTRSDIYSLGVLLYVLLTGSPPFSRSHLEQVGVLEMLRVIREEEPSKPSTKLSSAEGLPTLAANRGTEPARLTKIVRGELDWIVMKALEKDRNRRYETANGFAADVQRYLNDEQVQACPPSAGYRLRKLVRRHKGALAVAALVLFFLMLLGSGVGWAWRDWAAREAEAARQQVEREAEATRQQVARQAKVVAQVEPLLAEVDRLEKEQQWPEALAAARRAGAAVAGGEADEETAQRTRRRLKDLEFIDRLEQIRQRHSRNTPDPGGVPEQDYARAFRDYGVDVDELAVEASIERLKARPAYAIPLGVALDSWTPLRRNLPAPAVADWKRLVAIASGVDPEPLRNRLRSAPWPLTPEVRNELRRLAESINVREHHPVTLYRLATTPSWRGDPVAIRVLRQALIVYPGDYWLNYQLGIALFGAPRYHSKQNFDDAIRFLTVAAAIRPSAAGNVYNWIAILHKERGEPDEAIAVYRQAIEADPENAGSYWDSIGHILRACGKSTEADEADRKAAASRQSAVLEDRAENLLAQGKLDYALAAFRQAVVDTRDETVLSDIWRRIGYILNRQGKSDEAIAAWRQAVQAKRADREGGGFCLNQIAFLLDRQGKPDEAIAAWQQAIEANPRGAYGYWSAIGNLQIGRGKADEGIAAYRQAIAAYRNNLKPPAQAGNDGVQGICHYLRYQRKPDVAIAVYRLGIDALPERAGSYLFGIGEVLRDQGKLNEAADAFRKASELKPDDPTYLRHLGLALRDLKRLDEANAALGRAIDLYRKAPEQAPGRRYHSIAEILCDKGDLDGALAALRQAFEVTPIRTEDLVKALRARGRHDEVVAVYRKALEADPKDYKLHDDLGAALVQQGKLDEAIVVYRKAVELAPTRNYAAFGYVVLGHTYQLQKRMPEAIAAYHRAIELDPTNHGSGAYISLGNLLRDWGKLDEAAASYRKSIEFNDPRKLIRGNLIAAHVCLGDVLWQQSKLDEAIGHYRKVIDIEPNSPLSHSKIAWLLASRPEANVRDPKQAVELAKRATELLKNSEMTWQFLGWVQYRTGDWKASIEALEKSCQLHGMGTGDSGQWTVMALAHARLALHQALPQKEREQHKAEARRWFEKADKMIDGSWRTPPDWGVPRAIWDFRVEARELIAKIDDKK